MNRKFVPCIYLYRGRAVRSLQDKSVLETDPVRLARYYSENNADEMIVFDMSDIAAAEGEKEEWTDLYPSFADVAEKEGFPDIAYVWREIAEAEERHEIRYRKLVANIKNNKIFEKDVEVEWKCNNCGYIHKGKSAPDLCPACDHAKGYFEVFCETY